MASVVVPLRSAKRQLLAAVLNTPRPRPAILTSVASGHAVWREVLVALGAAAVRRADVSSAPVAEAQVRAQRIRAGTRGLAKDVAKAAVRIGPSAQAETAKTTRSSLGADLKLEAVPVGAALLHARLPRALAGAAREVRANTAAPKVLQVPPKDKPCAPKQRPDARAGLGLAESVAVRNALVAGVPNLAACVGSRFTAGPPRRRRADVGRPAVRARLPVARPARTLSAS